MKEARHLIGLTGGIGAGKSVVARILRLKGYEVYDCDLRARHLMENAERIVAALTERFGAECYNPRGCLNRRFLAERIFSNEEERLWVNSLVHEAVREDLSEWSNGKETSFVESAILHSSGLDSKCTEIWVVDAPEDLRFRRAIERGGIDKEGLRARMEVQQGELDALPIDKVRIIDNSGAASLLERIDQLLNKKKELKNQL